MNSDQNDQKTDPPFFPSGYTPEVTEDDSGYNHFLHVRQSQFSGPIPPPESLEYYEGILAGAADRILRMAEENARSVRESNAAQWDAEKTIERNRHDETKRGQFFALATVLSMVVLAGVALGTGHPAVAGTICSFTIGAVATVFVTGRKKKESEKDGPA